MPLGRPRRKVKELGLKWNGVVYSPWVDFAKLEFLGGAMGKKRH